MLITVNVDATNGCQVSNNFPLNEIAKTGYKKGNFENKSSAVISCHEIVIIETAEHDEVQDELNHGKPEEGENEKSENEKSVSREELGNVLSQNLGFKCEASNQTRESCAAANSILGEEETNFTKVIPNSKRISNLSQSSSEQVNIEMKAKNEVLQARQLSAAKRSLETNLLIIIVFAFVYAIVILLPRREIFCLFVMSLMKGMMPVLTTIANFGTIQSVIFQYWEYLKGKLCLLVYRIK